MASYESTYGIARFIAKLISFLGWVIVSSGILGIILTLNESAKRYVAHNFDSSFVMGAFGAYLCLSAVILGLLIIAGGQITRAVVDTADYNGEMLAILKGMAAQEKANIDRT